MFCKYCGKELANNVKFCSKCGGKLVSELNAVETKINEATDKSDEVKEIKFCKYCGKQLSATAQFCSKCGKQPSPILNTQIEDKSESPKTLSAKTEINQIQKNLNTTEHPQQKQEESENTSIKLNDNEKPETEKDFDVTQKIEKFSIRNLFVQVFKSHTPKERDEILKAGIVSNENLEIKNESFQPWLYSRVFLILLAVFGVFEIGLLSFHNSNLMPAVMLIGSLMIPFSLLTMYFELNVYKDISFYKVIGIFLLGGATSLLFTLFLYAIFPSGENYDFAHASLISVVEEIGKACIVMMLITRNKNYTVLHGLLIGGAIGCGFAVFESAGYAFNVFLDAHDWNTRANMVNEYLPWYYQYQYADSIAEMNFNIFLRSILSFGGHTAWAAITGASFAKEKTLNFNFIKMFAVCFILHAIWDTNTPAAYFKLIMLCIVAWVVIVWQISKFVDENFVGEEGSKNGEGE
ncbi:PrsW family glutamic-type intramembrane protease [uncultured Treponema sp.]|uniref:PrsW family glutamic-type intramembrane protease n=1 Tax=uncultured Treponema sp. TaxID=162155 RepID=UPI0025DEBE08|nr:PrsW family glutamic-type intramembrane protease [uncultured Treponema sp.]